MMEKHLVHIVTEISGVHPRDIKQDTTLDDLQIDSLDLIDIIMEVEEQFDVNLSDKAYDKLCTRETTFGELCKRIEESISNEVEMVVA